MISGVQKVFLTDSSAIGRELKGTPFSMATTWVYVRLDSTSMAIPRLWNHGRRHDVETQHTRHIIERLKFFTGKPAMYSGGLRYNLRTFGKNNNENK